MPTLLYALAMHDDIARFDLEDGLARRAAASLLESPSSITEVRVDLPLAGTLDLSSTAHATLPDALLTIEAGAESDARPSNLDELVVEVAQIVGAWSVSTTSITDRGDTWVGSATRGTTLHVLCSSGPGIDQSSYDAWRRDALKTCADELEGIGIREQTVLDTLIAGDGFETHIELSFPTVAGLDEAIASRAVAPIIESELLDPTSVRAFAASQHVHVPNENAWEMHASSGERTND